MLHKLEEKDESKKEKDGEIVNETNELDMIKNGEVVEIDNDELVVDATNDAPPPQDAMNTNTAAAAEEGRDEDDVCADDGNGNNEADDTKGGEEGGAIWRSETATMTTTKRT